MIFVSIAITPDVNFNGLAYVIQCKYINLNPKKFLVNLQNAVTSIYPSIDQENLLKVMALPDIWQTENFAFNVGIGGRMYYHTFPSDVVCEGAVMAELVFTLVAYYIYKSHCYLGGKED